MLPSALPVLPLTFPVKRLLPFLTSPAPPTPSGSSSGVHLLLRPCCLLSALPPQAASAQTCLSPFPCKTPLTQSSCTKQTFLKRWLMGADSAIRACCRKFFQMQHRASSVLEGHCPSPHGAFLSVCVPPWYSQGTPKLELPPRNQEISHPSIWMKQPFIKGQRLHYLLVLFHLILSTTPW